MRVHDRLGRVRRCHGAGDAVERGGEEQRLARTRHAGDDAVDRWAEAHVEHAIGLVEHEEANVGEADRAALEEILEPAGGRDDDVRPRGVGSLFLEADATVDGRDPQRAGRRDVAKLVDDLGRELPRRREHERRGSRPAGVDRLDHRDAERERLARAGR